MIKIHAVLALSLLAGVFGMCPVAASDGVSLPALRLGLKTVDWSSPGSKILSRNVPPTGMEMETVFELNDMPGWRIAWCEEDKARVTMDDSGGGACAEVGCRYSSITPFSIGGSKKIMLWPRHWLPGAGAQRVRIKGEIPFAVFNREAVTEPVTVKLVKGFSVPVVLKGGGLAGRDGKGADVNATLTVEKYEDADGKEGGKKLSLKLTADKPLEGCLSCELQLMDGLAVAAEDAYSGVHEKWINVPGRTNNVPEKDMCVWNWSAKLVPGMEEKLRIVIRHAENPRLAVARVASTVALSGLGEGDSVSEKTVALPPAQATKRSGKKVTGNFPANVKNSARGDAPVVTTEWVKFYLNVQDDTPSNGHLGKPSAALSWRMRMTAPLPAGFWGQGELMEQNLEVTDSTGRVLQSNPCSMGGQSRNEDKGLSSAVIDGTIPGWASPGAEWVRVKGAFRVPVARVKELPVCELSLKKGANLLLPIPGADIACLDDGDVVQAGEVPSCKLLLEGVKPGKNRDVDIVLAFSADNDSFDFENLELVDEVGRPLPVASRLCFTSPSSVRPEWTYHITLKDAAEMKKLRVKIKYRAGVQMVTVPVDVKLGLNGPVAAK